MICHLPLELPDQNQTKAGQDSLHSIVYGVVLHQKDQRLNHFDRVMLWLIMSDPEKHSCLGRAGSTLATAKDNKPAGAEPHYFD